jgi:YggT family protein
MERKEHVQTINDGEYARQQRVVEYKPETRNVVISRVNQLIWLLTSILVIFIALRFVLMMIAASTGSTFVDFIYNITNIFVSPFSGIVRATPLANGGFVDFGSLFAIVVYALLAWIVTTLLRILFTSTSRVRNVSTVERER